MFAYIKEGIIEIISSSQIEWDTIDWMIEYEYEWITSPYFDWSKIIEKPVIMTDRDIWVVITQEVYDGNPYAQIADLAKAQVTTLALLVPILGKEVVAGAYADLIITVKKVSEARVKEGLSPYDLSFLE